MPVNGAVIFFFLTKWKKVDFYGFFLNNGIRTCGKKFSNLRILKTKPGKGQMTKRKQIF